MTAEVVDLFGPVPPGLVVDATVGGGGPRPRPARTPTRHIACSASTAIRPAVAAATEALAPFGGRATVRRSPLRRSWPRWSAIVHEQLGVSPTGRGPERASCSTSGSAHPSSTWPERGFSYRRDAALDMRMDPTSGRTAADVVNDYDEDALVELFAENGEGRFARRIARAIVAARPLATTGQLADVVRDGHPRGHPAHRWPSGPPGLPGHPHRRQRGARSAARRRWTPPSTCCEPGGRCVVISYHSGEDRLVKSVFTRMATDDCQCPPGLPCVCGADAPVPIGDPRRAASDGRRGRSQPPGRGGPPAGHRAPARLHRRRPAANGEVA